MKKKYILSLIVIVGIVLLIVSLLPSDEDIGPNEWLEGTEVSFGIEFPKAEKLEYSNSNRSGIHGDGYDYCIVKYNKANTVVKKFNWKRISTDEAEYINERLDDLNVEQKYRPNCKGTSIYVKNGQSEFEQLFVIYNPEKPNNLYVLEVYI